MRMGFTRSRPELRLLAAIAACLTVGPFPAAGASDGPAQVLRRLHVQDQAIERVGFRLAAANADLCRAAGDAGFSVHTVQQYGPAYRGAALELFDLGGPPGVLAVAPGSPAEMAGLREGDAILAVDGQALPEPPAKARRADFSRTAAVQGQIAEALRGPVLNLVVRRNGAALQLEIHPVRACRSLFQVVPDTALKGEADGDYVQVSSEMAALAANDDELAALLAHELAHNVLGHRARLDALHVDRGLFAVFGRNARLIRATEMEADRLGIYLLARAGYDPSKAVNFWSKARAAAAGSEIDPTHPRWPDRLAAIRAEITRIDQAGVPPREVSLPPDLAVALPPR
jgi:Zn-dependent protease with chaperone function